MARFWISDLFIDEQARSLSVYAQVVFVGLGRFANRDGETFVGVRHLGECLKINKDTVAKAIKELIASGLVRHYRTGPHRVSGLKVSSVRPDEFQRPAVSDRRKYLRNIKEGNQKENSTPNPLREELRKRWGSQRI